MKIIESRIVLVERIHFNAGKYGDMAYYEYEIHDQDEGVIYKERINWKQRNKTPSIAALVFQWLYQIEDSHWTIQKLSKKAQDCCYVCQNRGVKFNTLRVLRTKLFNFKRKSISGTNIKN